VGLFLRANFCEWVSPEFGRISNVLRQRDHHNTDSLTDTHNAVITGKHLRVYANTVGTANECRTGARRTKARHLTQDCLTGRLVDKISNYLQGSPRLSQC